MWDQTQEKIYPFSLSSEPQSLPSLWRCVGIMAGLTLVSVITRPDWWSMAGIRGSSREASRKGTSCPVSASHCLMRVSHSDRLCAPTMCPSMRAVYERILGESSYQSDYDMNINGISFHLSGLSFRPFKLESLTRPYVVTLGASCLLSIQMGTSFQRRY